MRHRRKMASICMLTLALGAMGTNFSGSCESRPGDGPDVFDEIEQWIENVILGALFVVLFVVLLIVLLIWAAAARGAEADALRKRLEKAESELEQHRKANSGNTE
jgi:hypothetical protein